MKVPGTRVAASLLVLGLFSGSVYAVVIDTVRVGNPGNPGELSGQSQIPRVCGSVDHAYNIGKYEVTASQYTAFLNAVATTEDTYGLYNTSMWSRRKGDESNIDRIGPGW